MSLDHLDVRVALYHALMSLVIAVELQLLALWEVLDIHLRQVLLVEEGLALVVSLKVKTLIRLIGRDRLN